mmetsp:Transcript_1216/g.1916  ORF Transcript_1216/g.1916 Transcript_1216/m.1916 type:complete len:349 (+) Transcript_1216:261-1307(+)
MSNENRSSSSPLQIATDTDTGTETDSNISSNGDSSTSKARVFVHESESFQIWRNGDTLIKMKCPTAAAGDDVEIRVQLMNEYTTLKRLEGIVAAKMNATNSSLGKDRSGWRIRGAKSCNNGKELLLEWVNGITLRDWIALHPPSSNKDIPWPFAGTAARIMKEIAAAVAAIHAAGVVHNDLNIDHVIVNADEAEEGATLQSCCVTIIGFGRSELLSSIEKDDTGEIACDDLFSMGLIYQEIVNPSAADDDNLEKGGAIFPTSLDDSLDDIMDSFRLSFRRDNHHVGDASSSSLMDKDMSENPTALQRLRDLIAALAKAPGSPMEKFKSAADIEAEFFFSVLPYIQTQQ